MHNTFFVREMLACLRAEAALRPALQAQDRLKFLFQGMLGAGHLLSGQADVEARTAAEMRSLRDGAGEALYEPVSPSWGRLNLRPARAASLTPGLIAAMMLASQVDTGFTREDVICLCRSCAEASGGTALAEEALRLADENWLPSHSETYRKLYHPAYRLIGADWAPLLPALAAIAEQEKTGRRILITLDGPCASGKTTMAERIAGVTGAAVLHTDDFVVPHAQKTAERLAQPGGNCDWERLTAEVLLPWKEGRPGCLRRYDCGSNRLLPPEALPGAPLLLLEGCYANLPAIRGLADVRLFLDAPESLRLERLRRRESPASLQRFMDRWIPLENAYLEAFRLPDPGCIPIRTTMPA